MSPSSPGPATQDEIDEHWLRHVYKPNEPQLTTRAALAGMLLGGVMSVANIYIGLKVGWSVGMALTSTILAFAVFALLRSMGIARRTFTMLENNSVASAASAAGYFSSSGMVSAIPALYLTQSRMLTWWELALWVTGVSMIGVLMAVPMRRQMIDIDRLPFPSGIACAETIRSMHDKASEAISRARALLVSALIAAAFEIPYSVGTIGKLVNPLTWGEYIKLPGTVTGLPLAAFGVKLNSSLLMYGLGAILGVRVGLSLAAGALIAALLVAPWLASHGIVFPGEATIYRSLTTTWVIWPGVLMVTVSSLLGLALKWRTLLSAFGNLARMFDRNARPSRMAEVEIPGSWFGWGMLVATIFITACARLMFDIPLWMGLLAVALAFLLSIVACRAAGETDIAPLGPLGKIAQLVNAGLAPGHYQANLMNAGITAGSAAHSSDLLTDLKTGYILGGAPRRQFIAQFLGIMAGGLFCIPTYLLVARPEKVASAELPAPAAQQWAAVADLLAYGVSYVERGAGVAVPATVETVRLRKRVPGMAVGDTLLIHDGPNAGRYRVTMMDRDTVVLDRPLASAAKDVEPAAELLAPDGASRGRMQLHPGAGTRPALRFITRPPGATTGDYVLAVVDGVDLWHRMGGLHGEVAMLDHAFVGSGEQVEVRVKKMGLPPYALGATVIAVLFGVIITVLEVKGPRRWRPYLPSVAGMGIAAVVPCWDSLSMAVGAVVAWIISRLWPKPAERYTIASSSGIIAGASLIALTITLLRDVLGVIQTP